jgi:acyl carrier protein
MDRTEVLEKVNEIARDVFENDEVVLTDESTANDVEEWDSLTHLSLISDIEEEFKINFTLREISGFNNVGELIDALIRHIEEK